MLYLNNPLLTSDKILSYFEENLALLRQVVPEGSKKPSPLSQFKSKLKANFFNHLDKNTSDQDVLAALATDDRFTSSFPKLKQVLSTIFALTEMDNKTEVLNTLKAIETTD